MTRILVIGGGADLQPRLRRAAAGVSTVVICRASVLRFVQQLPENEAVVVLQDGLPMACWLAAARSVNAQWPVTAIVSLAEVDQDKAAAIAADLGLVFHSGQTVEWVHDKHAMRLRLREADLCDIPFRQVHSPAALAEFLAQVGPPLLLKPTKGRASLGIAPVLGAGDVTAAFSRTAGAREERLEPSPPLAERLVTGPEFSVEAITHEGRHYVFAVTEKFKDEESKVELGHLIPARVTDTEAAEIISHTRACLDALGVSTGITHSEVILGAAGPLLVETHLRKAGDEITALVADATGVDITDILLRQMVGTDVARLPEVASRAERPRYTGAAAIWYLGPPESGVLAGIDGLAQAAALPGVLAATQLAVDGTALAGLHSSYDRLAFVRVHAADADEALDRARHAAGTLTVRRAQP